MQLCSSVLMNSSRDLHPSCNFEEKELRRIRNNDSARRSREARRAKEAKNRLRMVTLEQENGALRTQIDLLKKELEYIHLVILAVNVTWKTLLQNQF
ncbi:unnamed protein product [Brugia pahangi]|uniref:BZIP domain-containing protein n=1 Tax=Brugia pahangi TaxID=6280 RepID=A0A0N4TYJ8_BRUPA|nr:unnamed protein product [Brugia pahangi]